MAALTVSCPHCGSSLAPHAVVCGDCNSLLIRDEAGGFVAGRSAGKRSCPRCSAFVPYPAQRCVNCGRTIHNAYRVAALATVLVLLLLGGAVAFNRVRRLSAGRSEAVSLPPPPADQLKRPPAPPQLSGAEELKAAREMFVRELGQEYERKEAGIEVSASSAVSDIITFKSKRFTRAQVERLRANEEAMSALRNLGFREAVFTNGAGGEWSERLADPAPPRPTPVRPPE